MVRSEYHRKDRPCHLGFFRNGRALVVAKQAAQVDGVEPGRKKLPRPTFLSHELLELFKRVAPQVLDTHGGSTAKRKGSFETNILPLAQTDELALVVHLALWQRLCEHPVLFRPGRHLTSLCSAHAQQKTINRAAVTTDMYKCMKGESVVEALRVSRNKVKTRTTSPMKGVSALDDYRAACQKRRELAGVAFDRWAFAEFVPSGDAPSIVWRHRQGVYAARVHGELISVPETRWNELRRRYRGPDFEKDVSLLLLRYAPLHRGLQAAAPAAVFDLLVDEFDVTCEVLFSHFWFCGFSFPRLK